MFLSMSINIWKKLFFLFCRLFNLQLVWKSLSKWKSNFLCSSVSKISIHSTGVAREGLKGAMVPPKKIQNLDSEVKPFVKSISKCVENYIVFLERYNSYISWVTIDLDQGSSTEVSQGKLLQDLNEI